MKIKKFLGQTDRQVSANLGVIRDYPWVFGIAPIINLRRDVLKVVPLDTYRACAHLEGIIGKKPVELSELFRAVGVGVQWREAVRAEALDLRLSRQNVLRIIDSLQPPGGRVIGVVVCEELSPSQARWVTVYRPVDARLLNEDLARFFNMNG